MPGFISRIFGGGKKKAPAPAPQVSRKPKASVDQNLANKQKASDTRRGKARNRTNFTGPTGISVQNKSNTTSKYLTGA